MCVCVHVHLPNKCVWSEGCSYIDVSTNLQMYVRDRGKKERETKTEGARRAHTDCRTEIVMGLITKKWAKHSTESLHARFCKSILLVQRKTLCMEEI